MHSSSSMARLPAALQAEIIRMNTRENAVHWRYISATFSEDIHTFWVIRSAIVAYTTRVIKTIYY